MKKCLFVFALLLTNLAYGVTTRGTVTYIGTYGNGDVYVALDTNIPEFGCSKARFDVPKTRANAQNILSTAHLSMEQNKIVEVTTKGCYNEFPTLDNSRNT